MPISTRNAAAIKHYAREMMADLFTRSDLLAPDLAQGY